MTQIALAEAQQRFAELVEAVGSGEEFLITLDGKPVAKVSAADTHKPARQFGSAHGKVYISGDFNAPLDDFADYV